MYRPVINSKLFEDLKTLILNRTGLFEALKNEQKLQEIILSCYSHSGLSDLNDFYWELEKDESLTGPRWSLLLTHITVPESFFFRDEGQLNLLRSIIFPKLFEYAKYTRTLKIWSAGCSGGEEVYTLSIMLKELLGDTSGWKIRIIGTDISSRNIEKAKAGVYTQWSLRTLGPMKTETWFTKVKSGFRIKDEFRDIVEFWTMNLIGRDGKYPEPFEDIDLIICRNVFIYFRQSVIQDIVAKFSHAMNSTGFAMFGHAEYVHETNKYMVAHYYPQSVVYQKAPPGTLPSPLKPSAHSGKDTAVKSYGEGRSHSQSGRSTLQTPRPYSGSHGHSAEKRDHRPLTGSEEQKASGIISEQKKLIDDARALANSGNYIAAEKICGELITKNIFEPYPYFLLGQIAHEKNEIDKAQNFLKKVLYLKSDHIGAMIELASIYQAQREDEKASKLRKQVADILEKMQPDTIITDYDDISVKELITLIKNYT